MKTAQGFLKRALYTVVSILKWPLAALFVVIGFFLMSPLFTALTCDEPATSDETPQQGYFNFQQRPDYQYAKYNWSGPGQDGGPVISFPRYQPDKRVVRARYCQETDGGDYLIFATLALGGCCFFIFALAMVRFPNVSMAKIVVIALWVFFGVSQIVPFEMYFFEQNPPPLVLVITYNIAVGGILFEIVRRISRSLSSASSLPK